MNYKHYLAIGLCVLALVVVYLFGNTKKPKDLSQKKGPKQETTASNTDIEATLKTVNSQLSKDTLAIINALLKDPENVKNIDSVAHIYNVAGFSGVASYYLYDLAKKKNELALWVKAGDQNYQAAMILNSPENNGLLFQNALACFKKATELAPTNTSYQIKLAQCYMDGTQDVMSGVGILRDIVAKDSNNAEAQFTLGRFGIVSKQFDKAIKRLEKVVSLQPSNVDAYLLLAEAYENVGENKSAVSALEKAKKLIKDPDLTKEINDYIKHLKQ